jgi:hypothetical protein
MTAPACARAVGSRRDLTRLATLVTASTTPMTARDTAVVISGTRGLRSWPQCRISLTPMNAKMSARPLDRYQAVEQAGHQEEQRPQAQQGEGVGGEDDEQWGDHSPSAGAGDQPTTGVGIADRHYPA